MNKPQNITLFIIISSIILIASCSGCNENPRDCYDLLSFRDATPPVFIDIKAQSPTCLQLSFNEKLMEEKNPPLFLNDAPHTNFAYKEKTLCVYTREPITPGEKVTVQGRVKDLSGNTTHFTCTTYGANQNPASLLINEFTTKGTSKSPDRVELVALKSGCLAGLTLYNGTIPYDTDRCVLPNTMVSTGEYIVITFQEDPDSLTFESENHAGLSANNGTISLYQDPSAQAPLIDAVAYSTQTASTFEGFGSKDVLSGAQLLCKSGQWQYTTPLSSAAIDCTTSTATRSINRSHTAEGIPVDTNSQSDWYVTKTGGQSFGSSNTKEHYEPRN